MSATIEEIQGKIMEGELPEAQEQLEAIEETDENRVAVLYLKGRCQEQRGCVIAAMQQYEEVLQIDSSHREALFRLAYLSDLRGDDQRAIKLYTECTSEVPAHIHALLNLAILYEENGLYDHARDCLRRVLEEHPEHRRARLFLKDLHGTINSVWDEEADQQRHTRNMLLDVSVADFELSMRSRNCLKQMNINTLGDLLQVTEPELLSYKNFGETSLNEIKAMLSRKGLSLGQELLGEPEPATRDSIITVPETSFIGDPVLLAKPVSVLELSVRSRRCLQRLGIMTIGDLVSKSEAELLTIKNFGHTSLDELYDRLNKIGLHLHKTE